MRLLTCVVTAVAATLLAAAPAGADETPFPICAPVYMPGGQWFGVVCTDPAHDRCLAYGGGYVWNMCVVNPVPVAVRIIAPIFPA